ncbi:MAG: response regulator [Candidatus Paceibacterota bacterium]|jgi:CheY-like chemotaxis protein
MKKIKVLIIDDKPENIEAAKYQFAKVKGVEITTILGFQEFDEIFHEFCRKVWMNMALDSENPISKYDVVLTDLMMPPGSTENYSDQEFYHNMEFPFGISIAAFAKKAGVKHVGIVSLLDHHKGPFEWSLDFVSCLGIYISKGKVQTYGKLNPLIPLFDSRIDGEKSDGHGITWTGGAFQWKGWVLVYNYLLGL